VGLEKLTKRIVANPNACMGCGTCEVYCTVEHSKSKDIVKAYNREQPRPISRVRLEMNKPISFAIQCRHCQNAPCAEACLTGAMNKDLESGLVTHNPEKCMGCWTCVMVCPFGAIKMDIQNRIIAKCDRCIALDIPVCVAKCPNAALDLKEICGVKNDQV
jgi:carbon-monoxide dehydrogenase iron sulfur subunit